MARAAARVVGEQLEQVDEASRRTPPAPWPPPRPPARPGGAPRRTRTGSRDGPRSATATTRWSRTTPVVTAPARCHRSSSPSGRAPPLGRLARAQAPHGPPRQPGHGRGDMGALPEPDVVDAEHPHRQLADLGANPPWSCRLMANGLLMKQMVTAIPASAAPAYSALRQRREQSSALVGGVDRGVDAVAGQGRGPVQDGGHGEGGVGGDDAAVVLPDPRGASARTGCPSTATR